MSEFDFTCSAPILPPDHVLASVAITRDILTCASPLEIPFYTARIGRNDLCGICGVEESFINEALKRKYKTVLPICEECESAGKTAIVQRPYGKKSK